MLNNVESNILETFKNVYELKSTNFINDNMPNLNIIFDNEHIPEKLIDKFLDKCENEISYILEYTLIYSIIFNLNDIINLYKENNINDLINLDYEIKNKIVTYCIKYLINKKNNKLSNENTNKIKKDNIELFNTINNFNVITTINQIYRDIVSSLLNKYNNQAKVIEGILLSNNYDNDIIEFSNGTIKNENDLKHFKLFMTRIFLCDVYVLELHLKKDAMKQIPENMIPSFLPDFILDELASTPITEYIKECNERNIYKLPTNDFLRQHMIGKYFSYQKKNSQELIIEAEENHKDVLKKVYPLYELDKLN